MATIQERALVRLVAIAAAVPGVALAERSLRTGIERDATPAVIVRPGVEEDERFSDGVDRHYFSVELIVHTRGDPWDEVADPIVDALHTAVMRDVALRELTPEVRRVSREPEDAEADATAGQYTLRYRLTYLTRADLLGVQP